MVRIAGLGYFYGHHTLILVENKDPDPHISPIFKCIGHCEMSKLVIKFFAMSMLKQLCAYLILGGTEHACAA